MLTSLHVNHAIKRKAIEILKDQLPCNYWEYAKNDQSWECMIGVDFRKKNRRGKRLNKNSHTAKFANNVSYMKQKSFSNSGNTAS